MKKKNNSEINPFPAAHKAMIIIAILFIVFYSVIFHEMYYMQSTIAGMTDEEKLEYALTLDENELNNLYAHIKPDDATKINKLVTYYKVLRAEEADSFPGE